MPTTQSEGGFEHNTQEESWRSIWKSEITDPQEETKFLHAFSETIDTLLKNNDGKTASTLLNDFDSFIATDKRSFWSFVRFLAIFPKILEWHFLTWEKGYQVLDENPHQRPIYQKLFQTLDSTLKKLVRGFVIKAYPSDYLAPFGKHIEMHKEKSVKGEDDKDFYYLECIFPLFFITLTESIGESGENIGVWRCIPDSWGITRESIEKKENYIQTILLHEFLPWVHVRISHSADERKSDKILDGMISNLFPAADPTLLLKLLTLWVRPRAVKSLIEQEIKFLFSNKIIGNVFRKSESNSSQKFNDGIKDREEASMEFIIFLLKQFPNKFQAFNKEGLDRFISEVEELKSTYDDKSLEKVKAENLILTFEKMKQMVSNR